MTWREENEIKLSPDWCHVVILQLLDWTQKSDLENEGKLRCIWLQDTGSIAVNAMVQ